MGGNKILVIEADELMGAAIASALESEGFEVISTTSAVDGVSKLYESYPDIVIVADELLSLNTKLVYQRLLEVSEVPIIVLDSIGDGTVSMLEAGADVCMIRPPHLPELVARVRSLLRRGRRAVNGRYRIRLTADLLRMSSKRVRGDTSISQIELRLLSCLLRNKGKVVDNSQLINEVWGEKRVTAQCLRFYIRRLRQNIDSVYGRTGQIINQRGIGYSYSESGTDKSDRL